MKQFAVRKKARDCTTYNLTHYKNSLEQNCGTVGRSLVVVKVRVNNSPITSIIGDLT